MIGSAVSPLSGHESRNLHEIDGEIGETWRVPATPPLVYVAGDVEIDVARSSIRRADQELYLRAKTFQVLLYLIENRERAVPKDEILAAVWPDTTVTEDTLVQSIVDIRRAVGDDPREPWFIRTVPRRGYQFIAPVQEPGAMTTRQTTALEPATTASIEETRSVEVTYEEVFEERKDWRHFLPHIAVAVVVLILGGIGAFLLLKEVPAEAGAASRQKTDVAVARFQNRASPDLDWLRDGLPGMIVTQLATAPELRVISGELMQRSFRRTATTGAQRDETAAWMAVAKAAGAERLIAGEFHRAGDQIRIDAQLFDVATGRIVGGGSIVSNEQSLLSDIDVLTTKLANSMGSPLSIAANRLTDLMTADYNAYRHYTLGLAAAERLENNEAIAELEKAIALDPGFAMAHARIGYAYSVTWALTERARPYFEKALRPGTRLSERERIYVSAWQAIAEGDYPGAIEHFRVIVSRYPTDVEAYERLGRLLTGEERLDEAIEVLRRGLAVDPESPQLNNAIGQAESYAGQHAAAITHHLRLVKLAPDDPNAYDSLGLSYQWAGQYDRALQAYDHALRLNPRFEVAVAHRANTSWQLGRNREAIREIHRYIEIAPSSHERGRGFGELVIVYRSLGDLEREAEAAREASHDNPPGILYAVLLAVDRKDAETAARLLQSITAAYPGRGARVSPRFRHYLHAEVARASGDRARAIASAREALRHLPPVYTLNDLEDVLGDTLSAFAAWPEAIAEYGRVLTLNAQRGRTRYKLARALESAGRRAEALAEYERFLTLWKDADRDAPEVVDARARAKALKSR